MKFLLQVVNGEICDVEVFNVKYLLDHSSILHEYKLVDLNYIIRANEDLSDWIPVGTLLYVQEWLKKYWDIEKMRPIEVPKILRKEKFLKREYNIVVFEDLELEGYKFLKDIDNLKVLSYIGDLSHLDKNNNSIFKGSKYLVSNVVDIVSEYRIFVSDLEIKAIQFYDGNCTVFPNIPIIREMVGIYNLDQNRPKSYTLDIAVLKEGFTVILEVHPVTSVGTYGYTDKDILYMYRDGIEYYKKQGKI